MVYWNSFDGQIYTLGKGPTATAFSIQNDVLTHGNSVLLKGLITDESPGTKDSDRLARFPHGVPAVSDASMSEWMEYVYMQQPRPADINGVEVVISVLDPNNNSYEVGRTTSDANGMFSLLFEPEVSGEYTVIASFAGSESYWPSSAQTAIAVMEAPEPTATPTQPPESVADMYFVPAIAGIIAAIAIGFALVILMLRKRP
jgi:hypothetical protein